MVKIVILICIVLFVQIFFYVGGFLGVIVMSWECFLEVALVFIVYNVCIIVGGVLLGLYIGIEGFLWGVLIGVGLGFFGFMFWVVKCWGL